MRVVIPAIIIIGGMYGFALYGPMPFTTGGLLAGVVIVFGLFMCAYAAFAGLGDSDDADPAQ